MSMEKTLKRIAKSLEAIAEQQERANDLRASVILNPHSLDDRLEDADDSDQPDDIMLCIDHEKQMRILFNRYLQRAYRRGMAVTVKVDVFPDMNDSLLFVKLPDEGEHSERYYAVIDKNDLLNIDNDKPLRKQFNVGQSVQAYVSYVTTPPDDAVLERLPFVHLVQLKEPAKHEVGTVPLKEEPVQKQEEQEPDVPDHCAGCEYVDDCHAPAKKLAEQKKHLKVETPKTADIPESFDYEKRLFGIVDTLEGIRKSSEEHICGMTHTPCQTPHEPCVQCAKVKKCPALYGDVCECASPGVLDENGVRRCAVTIYGLCTEGDIWCEECPHIKPII